MSIEPAVTDERLAQIATAAVSAQPWESAQIAAECLARRIAARGSRKPTPPSPAVAGPTQSES